MPYIQAVPRAIAVPSRQLRKPRDAANIQVDQWRAVERRGRPLLSSAMISSKSCTSLLIVSISYRVRELMCGSIVHPSSNA